MATLTYTGNLVIERCWCGIAHAVPSDLVAHQRRQWNNGEAQVGIYCPLGHSWIFSGKGEAALASERADAAERRAEQAEATARYQRQRREAAERSAIAYRGHLTRIKNRIAAGVCPVPGCKRTGLIQTMRHIASKHPAWAAEHAHEIT